MPGNDIWFSNPGGCRDRRVAAFGGDIDPDTKPMKQSSFSAGSEFQVGRNSVFSVHYIHNDLLETIEDVGFLNADGDEGYIIGNPGKGLAATQFASGAHAGRVPDSSSEAPVRRARVELQPPVRGQLLLQRELHPEPSLWQLLRPGLVG